MAAGLASMSPEDLVRLFSGAPLGPTQSFAGTSGTIVGDQPQAAPSPMGVPLPPRRPTSPGFDMAADPPAPDATPIVAPGFGAPAMPAPKVDAAPATTPAEPSFGDTLKDGLTRFRDKGGFETLGNIGIGLMSQRGFGPGVAAGLMLDQDQQTKKAATDLSKLKTSMEMAKFQQETTGQNATKQYLLNKGFDPSLADAAMGSPAVLQSVLSQLHKDPTIVEIGGNKYSLRPGEKPTEANLLGPAKDAKDDVQLVSRPDGSVVVVNKSNLGTPGVAPSITTVLPSTSKAAIEREERRQSVLRQNKDPNDPRFSDFIISGSLPKESQQQLTAADKQAIREGEDRLLTNQNAITQLKRALELSPKAYEGVTAGARAAVVSNLPEFMGGGSEAALATREFDNTMSTQMLDSLKAIFGGNPTEGERAALKDIQGISSMPAALRETVIKNALAKVEGRMRLEQQLVDQLRGGTYYKPGGGGLTPPPQADAPTGYSQPKSKVDYDALPSGAKYIAPDGSVRTKP